jgi:tetratricopeptide (TPR) repeat protein
MNEGKADIKDPTLLVDINEATLAVKENRFADALEILEINLSRYPDHIDSLYLAAVSARYLKKYDQAKKIYRDFINSCCRHGQGISRIGSSE